MVLKSKNPYRSALAGLQLADPVKAFFDWCREREAVRVRRESGAPFPWSKDPIFQKGRFLNVFREDDRGTKAVFKFVEPVRENRAELVHALFFARWCNQRTTLEALTPDILKSSAKLKHALLHEVPQPWSSEVYPVVSAQWRSRHYDRLDACVELFPVSLSFLMESIEAAEGNVRSATRAINLQYQMTNDFPIFMALVDLALFAPELIRPDSPVPTGIGAEPYLDLLQKQLKCSDHPETAERMIELQPQYWPEARRRFTPIDIEYLACECRKYYSYVTGTKKFEGKNLFIPKSDY